MLKDWARIMDIEFVHISKDSTPDSIERELAVNDLLWKLK
jgi:L-arabinose isomerase